MPAMDYSRIAALYDLYAQTTLDVPFFLQEAAGCSSVLELTSGTGRLSIPLLLAKIPLTCVDNSAEMLEILNQKLHTLDISAPVYQMDAIHFQLNEKYDLILIPFNSFSEFTTLEEQRAVLASIRNHLTDNGRFICTLHNPPARLKIIDGQVHLRGTFELTEGKGSLALSSWESYHPETCLVTGEQIYEIFDTNQTLLTKYTLPIHFYLHTYESFKKLITSMGFQPVSLYGDYQYGEYDPEKSPFIIWTLKAGS